MGSHKVRGALRGDGGRHKMAGALCEYGETQLAKGSVQGGGRVCNTRGGGWRAMADSRD